VVLIHRAEVVLSGPTEAIRRRHSGNQIEIHCAGDTASPPPYPPGHKPVSLPSTAGPRNRPAMGHTHSAEGDPNRDSVTKFIFEAAPSEWPALIEHYNRHSRLIYFAERLPSFQDIFIQAVGPGGPSTPENQS
jgi:hypothetical protein